MCGRTPFARRLPERAFDVEDSMFNNIRTDIEQYMKFGSIWSTGLWVTAIYRIGSFAKMQCMLIRIPLMIIYFVFSRPIRFFYNIEIPANTKIGPGLYMPHPRNILISKSAIIGQKCSIFHGVTIGTGPRPGPPIIGNNVVLFIGSCILGGITVGDYTEVGPYCVLTNSVKERMIVVSPVSRALPQALVRKQDHMTRDVE
jgi:serine O-acetyltransferase